LTLAEAPPRTISETHQAGGNGRGWSLAIDRASGRMSGTIAETEGAFVVTGACRAP
jgi:hypothetical protein